MESKQNLEMTSWRRTFEMETVGQIRDMKGHK
jgi:hypothetical protein